MTVDVKGIIAVLVVVGSFGLIAGYIFTGGKLDTGTGVAVVAFCSSPMSLVIGFYFGHINGAATALAQASTALASQALVASVQRRTGDPTPPPVVAASGSTVVAVVPPAAGSSS